MVLTPEMQEETLQQTLALLSPEDQQLVEQVARLFTPAVILVELRVWLTAGAGDAVWRTACSTEETAHTVLTPTQHLVVF